MNRRLILIGGTAGSGKTSIARRLSGDLDAGWLQLDTVWIAMKASAEQGSSKFELLDVDGRMRRGGDTDDVHLAAQVAASQAVCEVLLEVFTFELAAHWVLVADGAWLLPSFVAALELPDTEVSCAFLQHVDVNAVAAALAPRLTGRRAEERTDEPSDLAIRCLGLRAGRRLQPASTRPQPFSTIADRTRAALAL